jgi:UDP-N-acetylmuramyl pentapeptide synthase
VGKFAAEAGFDVVAGLGEGGRTIAEGARAAGMAPAATPWFARMEDLAAYLAGEVQRGDVVLLKASRCVRLEEILALVDVRGG